MQRGKALRGADAGNRAPHAVRLGVVVLMIALAAVLGPVQSLGQAPPGPAPQPAPMTPDQLDELLAPIALYPDPLLGQILMAATYPLEIVHAARWLQDPMHAALTGPALAATLDLQPWDPSVKALVPFPDVLRMMEASLDWTESVGDAFLADEGAVMDAVQRLRQRAQSAGTLVTTAQQTVSTAEGAVVVLPADPNTVYVPAYDPRVVYGTWVYAPYPPYGPPPAIVYPYGSPVVGFGVGIAIVAPLWGWYDWDWPHRRFHVDPDRYSRAGGHHPPPGGTWQHDPDHRRGVPYRDPGTRARFPGPPQGDVRGYGTHVVTIPGLRPKSSVTPPPRPAPTTGSPNAAAPPALGPRPGMSSSPTPSAGSPSKGAAPGGAPPSPRAGTSGPLTRSAPKAPASGSAPPRSGVGGTPAKAPSAPKTVGPAPGGPAHPAPPAFESFGRAADVHTQTERGQSSRRAVAPQSRVPAPTPHAGPAPRGAPKPSPGGGQPHR